MKEWNAIDLHMHTVVGITGDCGKDKIDNFTYKNYINSLNKHDIKLAAITNHNKIDLINYIICRYLAKKKNINILFGVEIDTETEEKKNYHFVALFNEELIRCINIANKINSKTEQKIKNKKIRYSPDDIIDIIQNYNCIIIPHGEKSKGMLNRPTEEQIIEALKKIKEGYIRVFDNNSDWELSKIKSYIIGNKLYNSIDNFGGVLFSDNRDWLNYGKKFKNFYMNAEPTYKGLLHSITNPTERFNIADLIQPRNHYISKIEISSEKNTRKNIKVNNCIINFKSGYNCIIGKSGSGKSLLLYLIKRELLGFNNNYQCALNNIVKIYDENNNLLNINSVNIGIGDNLYNKIVAISDSSSQNDIYEIISKLNSKFIAKEKFNNYVSKYKEKIADYVDLKGKIISDEIELSKKIIWISQLIKESTLLKKINSFDFSIPIDEDYEYSDEEIFELKTIKDEIISLMNKLNLIKNNKKTKLINELEIIKNDYEKIYEDIYKIHKEQKYKNLKLRIIRQALENVNKNISYNANRKVQLKSLIPMEIKDSVDKIIQNYINKNKLRKYDLSINPDEINSEKLLVENSNIVIKETIDVEKLKKIDIKDNDIFYTQGIKSQLVSKNYNMLDKDNVIELINKYFQYGKLTSKEINLMFTNTLIETNIYFDGQNINELNPGDIAKTYIQTYFKNELNNGKNSIILFDQIENDVDKEFINNIIINSIKEMKKQAQVIIVTHDPIVAVNADPTNYIESIKDKRGKIIYRSFSPESTLNDELTTIAKIVDGSKDVIRKRYEIYKGDNK